MLELAAAALPLGITDFSGLKLWVLGFGGNLLIAILVVRLIVHFLKSEWGAYGTILRRYSGGLLRLVQ